MKLVVFYSRTGNVKKAAQNYAATNNCEIEEIKDLANLDGKGGFFKGVVNTVFKRCTPIAAIEKDLLKYDTVVVCTPVWGGTFASPVRTFLKKYSPSIKNIEYIIVHADKTNEYRDVFDKMDRFCNKKHTGEISLVEGQTV